MLFSEDDWDFIYEVIYENFTQYKPLQDSSPQNKLSNVIRLKVLKAEYIFETLYFVSQTL